MLHFGPASATVFVRAFHVVVSGGGVAGLPAGGEIMIGAATAGVPSVALAPPSAPVSDAVATPGPYVAISTRAPIDTSIRESIVDNDNLDVDNDNFDDNGNGNGNGNDNGGGGTPGSVPATSQPIVVTVVIVPVTATPLPTATPTR